MRTGEQTRIQSVQRTNRPIEVLRLPEVCRVTGLGRSMIYRLEAEGRFPERVKIGSRAVGWISDEVQGWLAERMQSRRVAV